MKIIKNKELIEYIEELRVATKRLSLTQLNNAKVYALSNLYWRISTLLIVILFMPITIVFVGIKGYLIACSHKFQDCLHDYVKYYYLKRILKKKR